MKRWIEEGEIITEREAEDGSTQSFEICMNNGNVLIQNKRFLKQTNLTDLKILTKTEELNQQGSLT